MKKDNTYLFLIKNSETKQQDNMLVEADTIDEAIDEVQKLHYDHKSEGYSIIEKILYNSELIQ